MKNGFLYVLMVILAACSQGRDDGPCPGCDLPELNGEQKQRMQRVSQEISALTTATGKHLTTPDNSAGILQRAQAGLLQQVAVNKPSEVEQKTALYTATLESAFQRGDCRLKTDGPHTESTGNEQNQKMDLRLSMEIINGPGAQCPILQKNAMEMSTEGRVVGQQAQITGKISLLEDFQVPEESPLFESSDVVAGRSQGTVNIEMRASESSGVNATFTGNVVSDYRPKAEVEAPVVITSDLQMQLNAKSETEVSGSVRVVMRADYSDFTAVGHATIQIRDLNQDPQVTYQINGRPVSEEDYLALFPIDFIDSILDETSDLSSLE